MRRLHSDYRVSLQQLPALSPSTRCSVDPVTSRNCHAASLRHRFNLIGLEPAVELVKFTPVQFISHCRGFQISEEFSRHSTVFGTTWTGAFHIYSPVSVRLQMSQLDNPTVLDYKRQCLVSCSILSSLDICLR